MKWIKAGWQPIYNLIQGIRYNLHNDIPMAIESHNDKTNNNKEWLLQKVADLEHNAIQAIKGLDALGEKKWEIAVQGSKHIEADESTPAFDCTLALEKTADALGPALDIVGDLADATGDDQHSTWAVHLSNADSILTGVLEEIKNSDWYTSEHLEVHPDVESETITQ